MSKRLWRCFTKSIICSTSELNDNKKNLHALRWDRKIEKCQFNLTFTRQSIIQSNTKTTIHTWSHSSIVIDRSIWSIVSIIIRQSSINYVRINYFIDTRQFTLIETSDRSFSTWHFNSSFFVSLVLFSNASMKKLKTRAYQKIKKMNINTSINYVLQLFHWHSCQSIEICIQKLSTFVHFIVYFEIFNQNLIWSWMIYIACFLRSRNQ